MTLQLVNPWALAALILLPFLLIIGWPRLRRLPAWMRRTAMTLRLLIVTLFVLGLAQPLLGRTSEDISVIFALDESVSIAPETRANAEAFIQQALAQVNDKNRAGIVI